MNQLQMRPSLRALPGGIMPIAIVLALLLLAMRAAGTLGPLGWRFALPAMCVLMMIVPWILLDREGRR